MSILTMLVTHHLFSYITHYTLLQQHINDSLYGGRPFPMTQLHRLHCRTINKSMFLISIMHKDVKDHCI